MPQFNWTILGPVLLLIAGIAGGTVFLMSQLSSPAASFSRATVPSATPGVSQQLSSGPSVPAGGVRLPGRVTGTPHVRADAGSTATILYDLRSGESVEISACSPSCGWYLISAPEGPPGWVSSAFIAVQGDDRRLLVVR